MKHATEEKYSASITAQTQNEGILSLTIQGRLDSNTTGRLWRETVLEVERASPVRVVVDASRVNYCDGSGIALLIQLRQLQEKAGREFEIQSLADNFRQLLNLFPPGEIKEPKLQTPSQASLPEEVGIVTLSLWKETRANIAFIGEAGVALVHALLNPGSVRWKDVLLTSEKIGVNALSIIALVNFLVGLVIAFQSAIPLKRYGGEIFVADLLVLSIFRELGPLMTAIVVNGRSGSAFAAELGTMKVNEEIDALNTMGLDPVRFLVVPKIMGAILMIPILTAFGDLSGLVGGGVVMLALGFPPVAYVNEMVYAASYVDLLLGLFKSIFFAAIIAGVGCLEGLRTKTGAAAVGDSATSAVVSGIVLIIFIDGIFGVLFYYLGI